MIALEKPVYASFGDVSASGAYWLSTACKKIVAGKNGITGSIGVFGLNFSAQKLANNFGITFDGVKTEKYADMPTISRPLNPEELAIFQKSVNRTYEKFLSLVSQGRNLAIEDVATLAEGKIYTSTQAKKLGLVDEIYTLYTLVERVKQNAENDCLDRLAVLEYPTLPTFVELLQSMEILETPFVKTLSSVFAPKFTNEALLNTKFFERFKNAKSREVQAELPIILTSEF